MIDGESSTRIERPVDQVFEYVSNPVNDEKWHKTVLRSWRTSEGPIGVGSTFKWDAKFLGRREADVEVTRYEPTSVFAEHVQSGWMEVVVTYELAAENGATRITRRTETPLPRFIRLLDPIIRPIARPFVSKDNGDHLGWLKQALEAKP
jgi:Polyketide cyclase / dehydrase and lipid transport